MNERENKVSVRKKSFKHVSYNIVPTSESSLLNNLSLSLKGSFGPYYRSPTSHTMDKHEVPKVAKAETQGHKRKRSIQDTPVNLNKIRAAMLRLEVLKEELADIEETEGEVEALMAHVTALEGILRGAKKPVCVLACTYSKLLFLMFMTEVKLFIFYQSGNFSA